MPSERFVAALRAFDSANARDPNSVSVDGSARPRELVDAERLSAWVERVAPAASEALQLAARCQHLRRWEIPRESYPSGRQGYLGWRKALAAFHADAAEKVLREVGYADDVIERVRRIVRKQGLVSDPDTQTMEDALCLSFIQHELEAFAEKHERQKVLEILRKTWRKMTPRGQDLARSLTVGPGATELLRSALEQR